MTIEMDKKKGRDTQGDCETVLFNREGMLWSRGGEPGKLRSDAEGRIL